MLTIERFTRLLGEAAASLPQDIFEGLNLGIGVAEGSKTRSDTASGTPALILGEYTASRQMGRGILLYYGSFSRVYPDMEDDDAGYDIILDVLKHELRHHLESLAGSRELEFLDAKRLSEL